jgi:hypothetical protein
MKKIILITSFIFSIIKIGWTQQTDCSDKKTIKSIQKALKSRGYELVVDGVLGNKTQACLCDYVQNKGNPFIYLGIDGYQNWQLLGIDSCLLKPCYLNKP